MKDFTVYILSNSAATLYIGVTANLANASSITLLDVIPKVLPIATI